MIEKCNVISNVGNHKPNNSLRSKDVNMGIKIPILER